jgi:hypothetical protein
MMWNFLVAGLASGCALVLYDGSPLRDPSFLWKLVDELGITIFGTSAKYIDQLSVGSPISVLQLEAWTNPRRKCTNHAITIVLLPLGTFTRQVPPYQLRYLITSTNTFTRTFSWRPLQASVIIASLSFPSN